MSRTSVGSPSAALVFGNEAEVEGKAQPLRENAIKLVGAVAARVLELDPALLGNFDHHLDRFDFGASAEKPGFRSKGTGSIAVLFSASRYPSGANRIS